jgi:uncharacterized small protein (DUF1192 family)
MLRRFMQAQQNRDSQPGDSARQISELQDRVEQLTEEIARLRANQSAPATAGRPLPAPPAGASTPTAGAKKAESAAPKKSSDKG